MHWSRYLVCLWPGLPELWYRGRWGGLPAALFFTAALNFLLVARFIYPEWMFPLLVRIACWVAVAAWGMIALRQISQLGTLLQPRQARQTPDGFPRARDHYLRGNWPEAEAGLNEALQIDPRDCQALLLLASIYRQSGRWEAASEALGQLARLETADGWALECQTERRKLDRAIAAATAGEAEQEASENASPADTAEGPAASETAGEESRGAAAAPGTTTSASVDAPQAA
jgi:tetratricopeptide (TPR) repeat protein